MSTLLSWVALWALGFVRASIRARKGGCGSGSSLTCVGLTQPATIDGIRRIIGLHITGVP
jgi:hypothetical protein